VRVSIVSFDATGQMRGESDLGNPARTYPRALHASVDPAELELELEPRAGRTVNSNGTMRVVGLPVSEPDALADEGIGLESEWTSKSGH
jgi:hypothetical protein